MTARLYQFPPRRGHLYDPLVDYATPADIRRAIPDESWDLFETLEKSGYRVTWRDRVEVALDALVDDWSAFAADVRRSPVSHALVAVLAVIAWTALLVLPFVLGAL